jgi:glutamate--cysteine ligase
LEYSTAPHRKLADVERDLVAYLSHLSEAASARDFQFLALGFDPMRKIEEQKWFPKPRYDIMRPYLAGRGTAAWDMMTRTCATQVSLDFSSDEDLVRKFVAGNRLAPFVTAMFANSPFADGRVSGFKSTRARAWLDTDPDRCGIPELAWAEGFGIDDFIEYAINVPMLFRRRAGGYLNDVTGVPFRTYLQTQTGPAELLAADWADHLTTLFTEARIKQLIELRSMDCGSLAMVMAAQALWKGLLYDAEALAECERRLPDLSPAGTLELQFEAARVGLQAASDGTDVLSLARDLVLLATGGLQRIAPDEVKYLDILHQQVIEDAVCPADILLRNWHGSWHGSMVRLFAYVSVA